jgi:hypothetical protein
MSLFLSYFDDGPLEMLGGYLGHGLLVRVVSKVTTRLRGTPLPSKQLVMLSSFHSVEFVREFDPFLHRELFRFLATRKAAGWTPNLFFHWETGASDQVDANSLVEASVGSPEELFALLRGLGEDVVLRLTAVKNAPKLSPSELLELRLSEGDLPCLDGIIRGDGSVVLMQFRRGVEPEPVPVVRPLASSTLSAFWEFNLNEWVTLELETPRSFESEGISILSGKGQVEYERAGFVAVRNLSDGKLLWSAYFEEAGPFTDAAIVAGELIVVGARKRRWCFPLAHPEQVRIE